MVCATKLYFGQGLGVFFLAPDPIHIEVKWFNKNKPPTRIIQNLNVNSKLKSILKRIITCWYRFWKLNFITFVKFGRGPSERAKHLAMVGVWHEGSLVMDVLPPTHPCTQRPLFVTRLNCYKYQPRFISCRNYIFKNAIATPYKLVLNLYSNLRQWPRVKHLSRQPTILSLSLLYSSMLKGFPLNVM